MKRLLIFFFYDAKGIVDEYIDVMLEDISKNVDRIVVVCNGMLTPEGRRTFLKYSDTVIVRENKELDIGAYKAAFEYLGWDHIYEYDEMIMMNHTVCGPIYPFKEMFDDMEKRDVDFWGLSMYYGSNIKRPGSWPNNGYDYVQDHLQSHFIAVRGKMLRSYEFKKHWEDMPEIKEYNYSVAFHESIFTKKFSSMGFKYEIYLDTEDIKNYDNYPLMFNAHTLIKKKRSPFIKRKRNTFVPYAEVLNHDFNYGLKDMFDAINDCSDYDIDLLLKNTLRTSELYTFQRGSCLGVISSKNYTPETKINRSKICIIININNGEYYDNILKPAMDSVKGCNIIIIANEKISAEYFADEEITLYPPIDEENTQIAHKQIYKLIEDKKNDYDFIISLNFDKKLDKASPPHHSFHIMQLKMLADSFISSFSQVDAVIDLFNKNKLQGILTGPPPVAGISFNNSTNYRNACANVVKKYAECIGVEHSPQNTYQYPYSNIFACRTAALDGFIDSLEECFGKNENLPYEVLVPLYAQSKGYYTSRIMSEHNALIYIDMLENIVTRLGGKL